MSKKRDHETDHQADSIEESAVEALAEDFEPDHRPTKEHLEEADRLEAKAEERIAAIVGGGHSREFAINDAPGSLHIREELAEAARLRGGSADESHEDESPAE